MVQNRCQPAKTIKMPGKTLVPYQVQLAVLLLQLGQFSGGLFGGRHQALHVALAHLDIVVIGSGS